MVYFVKFQLWQRNSLSPAYVNINPEHVAIVGTIHNTPDVSYIECAVSNGEETLTYYVHGPLENVIERLMLTKGEPMWTDEGPLPLDQTGGN